jgi:hypothetical protein
VKAGRSLDVLVAEHLDGWRWIAGRHDDVSSVGTPVWLLPADMGVGDVGPGEWTPYDDDKPDNRLTLFEVPPYSTDDGVALSLLASWPGDLHLHRRRGEWRCALYPAEPSADEWVARAATPALAICGALLKAKGVEVAVEGAM